MHELMAPATQQHQVFRVESKVGEVRSAGDVMDFKQTCRASMFFAASPALPPISCPYSRTSLLPLQRGIEGGVLCGDAALPSWVALTAIEQVMAASRAKTSARGAGIDTLSTTALLAGEPNLSILSCR
jgi:hypothetical protein